MKKCVCSLLSITFAGIFVQVLNAHTYSSVERSLPGIILQNRNSVTGFVFSESRRPIPDVYVELLSDLYTTISRTKTNGSGLFSFRGLPNGNFKVRVLTYGTDYEDQTRDISLVSISAVAGRGSTSEQIDFYLRVKKNAYAGPFATAPGVIFAQEVPKAAQKLYEEGINYLREKKEKEGFEKLKSAIEIFPEYYLALDRLGTEYVVRGYHRPAFILLTKAVEINPRSFSSRFGLGLAQFRLQQFDLAVENLQRATTLHNESINAYLWLGIALHQNKKLTQAETALIKANNLSKGESAEVHWQLARLYSKQNRYREAADELELFIKNSPQSGETEKVKETIKQLRQKATAQ